MLGAIAGDIIGSVYERNSVKRTDFALYTSGSRFTDDTVLTIAVAEAIMEGKDYARTMQEYGRMYPNAGYGGSFFRWLFSHNPAPYNSFGNGSAMRVSPVGFAFQTLPDVLQEAQKSACITHNHPEGIKGAQAVAAAVFLAGKGASKEELKEYISRTFAYNLEQTLEEIRPHYRFDVSCQGSVPQSIIAFLESEDFEDAVRKAVSLGGDSDTMACIAGGIAQAYYKKIPAFIVAETRKRLDAKLLQVVDRFNDLYGQALL